MDANINHLIKGFPIPIADLRLIVFSKLDGVSLGRCQRVCKQFKGDIESEKCQRLWRDNFAYELCAYLPAMPPAFDWRRFYIQQTNVMHNLVTDNFGEPVEFERKKNVDIESGLTFGDRLYAYDSVMRSLCCFSLSTGKMLKTIAEVPRFSVVELRSIDSNHFMVKSDVQISIWDASKDKCVFTIDHFWGGVNVEGTQVMFYTNCGDLQIWNFESKQLIKQIDGIQCVVAFPEDNKLIGNLFFVLWSNGQIRVDDIKKGEQLYTVESENTNPFTKMYATDKYIVALSGLAVPIAPQAHIFEAASGKLMHTIKLSSPGVNNFLTDGHIVEISHNQLIGLPDNQTRTVACWDLETGKIVREFTPPSEGSVYYFKLGDPDRLVITTTKPAAENIGVTIWDLKNQILLSDMHYRGCSNYFSDGTHVKIWNNIMYFGKWPKDKFHFWDLTAAKEIGTFSLDTGYNHSRLWFFDGSRFIVGTKEGAYIYNIGQFLPKKSVLSFLKSMIGWK